MSIIDSERLKTTVQPGLDSDKNRLDSWKQIALYLNREVRTAQRWEKHEGLPIHRQFHVKAGTVCAFRHEIDHWLEIRLRALNQPPTQATDSNQSLHWSSAMKLVIKSSGNGCWLCAVISQK